MGVLSACISAYCVVAREARNGHPIYGTRATDGYELLCEDLESNPNLLQEQPVFLKLKSLLCSA